MRRATRGARAITALHRGDTHESLAFLRGTPHASTVDMTTIKSFRELLVWQKAMDLTVGSFRLAPTLPRDEQAALGMDPRLSGGRADDQRPSVARARQMKWPEAIRYVGPGTWPSPEARGLGPGA